MTQVLEETEIKGGVWTPEGRSFTMTPVPAPEPLSIPKRSGGQTLNYSALEMRRFLGSGEKLLSTTTLYRWAEQREVPSSKIGGRIIFPKNKVNPYLQNKGII